MAEEEGPAEAEVETAVAAAVVVAVQAIGSVPRVATTISRTETSVIDAKLQNRPARARTRHRQTLDHMIIIETGTIDLTTEAIATVREAADIIGTMIREATIDRRMEATEVTEAAARTGATQEETDITVIAAAEAAVAQEANATIAIETIIVIIRAVAAAVAAVGRRGIDRDRTEAIVARGLIDYVNALYVKLLDTRCDQTYSVPDGNVITTKP